MNPHSTHLDEVLALHNAHVDPGLTVRVGIPVPSGKLAFHAFKQRYATMVSAQAFWNPRRGAFRVPEASDLYETDFALDSAGFTAVNLWQAKGAQPGMDSVYPWSYLQYLELAAQLRPSWNSAQICVVSRASRLTRPP